MPELSSVAVIVTEILPGAVILDADRVRPFSTGGVRSDAADVGREKMLSSRHTVRNKEKTRVFTESRPFYHIFLLFLLYLAHTGKSRDLGILPVGDTRSSWKWNWP